LQKLLHPAYFVENGMINILNVEILDVPKQWGGGGNDQKIIHPFCKSTTFVDKSRRKKWTGPVGWVPDLKIWTHNFIWESLKKNITYER
jgi:hypothetical protein